MKSLWTDKLGQISLAVTTLFWGAGATLQFIVLKWADVGAWLSVKKAAHGRCCRWDCDRRGHCGKGGIAAPIGQSNSSWNCHGDRGDGHDCGARSWVALILRY